MSSANAVITVLGSRDEIERRWRESSPIDAPAQFADAPGERGTEIHLETDDRATRARAMDELRRFKQIVETGVVTRSDGTPEGELAERKLEQRPAQPLEERELDKALA